MKTIKIKEEFQIPGTDYVLEAGDKIRVLREAYIPSEDDVWNIVQGFKDGKKFYRNKDMYEPEVEELLDSRYTSEGDFEQSVMQMFNLEEGTSFDKIQILKETTNEIESLIRDTIGRYNDVITAANSLAASFSVVTKQSLPRDDARMFLQAFKKAVQ